MIPITDTAEDLIDELDKQYPERCPDPTDSDRAIWIYAGKRQLVRELRASLERDERAQRKRNRGPDRVP